MHTQPFFFPHQLAFVNASLLVDFCGCELLSYCIYYLVFLSCFILSSEHKPFRLIFQAVSSMTIHLTWALLPFPLLPSLFSLFLWCFLSLLEGLLASILVHIIQDSLWLLFIYGFLRVFSFLTIPAYWLIQNHLPISLYWNVSVSCQMWPEILLWKTASLSTNNLPHSSISISEIRFL